MQHLSLKRLSAADVLPLQTIARATFLETFSAQNTEDNMLQYLSERLSVEALRIELECPFSSFYLAMAGAQALGYLKLNFGSAQTEPEDAAAMEIERIYTFRQYHGRGVGQFLLDKAVALAEQMQAPYVWLGVWEENGRALRFYLKNGFVVYNKHRFVLGNDVQTDLMMKRFLANFGQKVTDEKDSE